MDEFPYLIAIALIDQGGRRAMPLGGKSLKDLIDGTQSPEEKGHLVALELLLRVFQRSEKDTLKAIAGDESLLIVQLHMDVMQEKLPILKSEWLKSGDKNRFISELKVISSGLWKINFARYEGIKFIRC